MKRYVSMCVFVSSLLHGMNIEVKYDSINKITTATHRESLEFMNEHHGIIKTVVSKLKNGEFKIETTRDNDTIPNYCVNDTLITLMKSKIEKYQKRG